MKKSFLFIILLILIIGGGISIFVYKNTSNKLAENTKSNYQAEKSNINVTTETTEKILEIEIANFSTNIHNKDVERQNNITITCNTLNGKEIAPGETFSFCETVGKATTSKGYQEADIYVDGEKQQGLGGGNCQVSTTLYNAVLQVQNLEVIERHEHSGHVPYIEKGKDAAVAYGSYDFKFKNNTENTIKIVMENTEDAITAKLIQKRKIRFCNKHYIWSITFLQYKNKCLEINISRHFSIKKTNY